MRLRQHRHASMCALFIDDKGPVLVTRTRYCLMTLPRVVFKRENVFYPVRNQVKKSVGALEKHGLETVRSNSE